MVVPGEVYDTTVDSVRIVLVASDNVDVSVKDFGIAECVKRKWSFFMWSLYMNSFIFYLSILQKFCILQNNGIIQLKQ